MAHPDTEALAGLVLGADWADDDPQVAAAVEAHVEQCAACRRTVAELRHALTIAGTAGALEAPSAGVWERVEAALDADGGRAVGGDPRGRAAHPPTRRDAAVPHRDGGRRTLHAAGPSGPAGPSTPAATSGPATPTSSPARPRRRRAVLWSAAAAVVGIGVGLGSGWLLGRDGDGPTPAATVSTTTVASVALDTLDTRQNLGRAALVRSTTGLDLRIATTRLDPGSGYLEVWLLNRDGKRMVSLGVLGAGGSDTFPVAQSVLDNGFVTVDISREAFDENLQHSGHSLVRGTLGI